MTVMTNVIRAAVVALSFVSPLIAPAAADELLVIRCVDYERPIIVSGKTVGWYKQSGAFDVSISPSRKIGWFDGATMLINEDKPANLAVSPDVYQLRRREEHNGFTEDELLVLDRVDGTLTHLAQSDGLPSRILRRGGRCSKVETKF